MKEKKILIVEDDQDHADLILDIFNTESVKSEVILMRDGQEIIDYLQKIDTSSGLSGRIIQPPLGKAQDVQPITNITS